MRVFPALSIGFASLLLVGFGCSPSSLVEKGVQAGINAQLGNKGSVDLNNGNVTVKDSASGTTASYGANVTLPTDFPKDVPILDGGTLVGAAVSADGAWASFTTSKSVDESTAWYESELTAAGFKKTGTYAASGTTSMTFTKDTETIELIAAGSDGTTTVTVTESKSQ